MSRTDPMAAFRFGVEIQGILSGLFTECSGLNVERELVEYKEGGTNDYVHKFPGRAKYSNITLKRGVAGDELWKWFSKGLLDGKIDRPNVSIVLFKADGSQAKRWDLRDPLPIKWSGPELKTDGNQVAIETIEFAHHGYLDTE